jgi:hypothetical protein
VVTFSICFFNASSIVRCGYAIDTSYADLIPLAHFDGLDDGKHIFKSLILGGQGPYVGLPSHSFLSYMGPQVRILMLDCR